MTSSWRLRWAKTVAAGVALAVVLAAQKASPPPAVDEVLPKAGPVQPIPFNHKVHAGVGIKCRDCHAIKNPGFTAGYPPEMVCMGCHLSIKRESPEIAKLAKFAKTKTPVPWIKVYIVPDYVWFSHASHVQDAKLECESCHGPVGTREVIAKEKPTNMHSCMQCHAKLGASNACDFCHSSQ